jgi:hypothetical protein
MSLYGTLSNLTLEDANKAFIEVKLNGAIFNAPLNALLSPVTRPYGAWQDMQTQSATAISTGYPMIYRTIDFENGVSVVSDGTNLTRILFTKNAVYNLQFSAQLKNTYTDEEDVNIWLRKNNSDVAGTTGLISVPRRRGGTDGHTIASWNYYIQANPGDFYQLMWSVSRTTITLQAYNAGNPPPATASIILTVHQL